MKYFIVFMLVCNTCFAQSELNKYLPKDSNVIYIKYSPLLNGDWLVHRIHNTNDYEIIIKTSTKNKEKAIKYAIKAYRKLESKLKNNKLWI